MATVKIAQCPLCKGTGTVNRSMVCPRCDGDGILDEKVLAAEHCGRLEERSGCSSASNELNGQDDTLPST
jgi:RecJ-like exonuclease